MKVLQEKLGRVLSPKERDFCDRLDSVYGYTKYHSVVSPDDIIALSENQKLRRATYIGKLWTAYPKSSWDLWLHIAFFLRKQNLSLPEFLEAITDTSLIGADVKQARRLGSSSRTPMFFNFRGNFCRLFASK